MNFHAKALLAFLAFHALVTGGGLLVNTIGLPAQTDPNQAHVREASLLLWILWCLALSIGALGIAYLARAGRKVGRGKCS